MKVSEPVIDAPADATEDRVALVQEIFPEVVSEGRIDFGKLKLALGDLVDDRTERYSFSWAGKLAAVRRLQQHTRSSLIPDADRSIDFDKSANIFIEGENLEVR